MIELLFQPTKDSKDGLIIWHLSLLNNGNPVDRINAFSGAPGAQVLNSGSEDYPGSLRPIPPGIWSLGQIEEAPVSWGPGLGKYWVDLQPMNNTKTYGRSAFGFHLDANHWQPRGRGSAGCIVTPSDKDLLRVLGWLRGGAKPSYLRVNHTVIGTKPENRYQINKTHRAWLDTIAWCEGTDGAKGYQTMFTGKIFEGFEDHPRRIMRSGGLSSDAAGRYQFLSTTWDECKKALKLTDFSPENQDQAAMWLIDVKRQALKDINQGYVEGALDRLSWEWASLPDGNGNGRYGQPIKSLKQFRNKLMSNLAS